MTRAPGLKREMTRVAAAVVLTLAAVVATPSTSTAHPAGATNAGDAVALEVTLIEASRDGVGVDAGLERFQDTFARSFKRFTRFRALGVRRATLPLGVAVPTRILDGKTLTARYESFDAVRRYLRVEFSFDGAKLTMQVRDGGLWFHAGRRHGKGILVLALHAKRK